jgi:hypothetical protein
MIKVLYRDAQKFVKRYNSHFNFFWMDDDNFVTIHFFKDNRIIKRIKSLKEYD